MRIEGNTVIFQSMPVMYEKEESGVKPNTVRILDGLHEEVELMKASERLTHIQIRESYHKHRFTRELTDISKIGEILGKSVYVFSWRHGE